MVSIFKEGEAAEYNGFPTFNEGNGMAWQALASAGISALGGAFGGGSAPDAPISNTSPFYSGGISHGNKYYNTETPEQGMINKIFLGAIILMAIAMFKRF